MRPLVLALDVGSSSVRAALYDRLGRELRRTHVRVPYAWDVDSSGGVRLVPERLLELVSEAIDGVHALAGDLAGDVESAGISCFLHSIVGADAAGRPLTPMLSWADTTSVPSAELRARIDSGAVHRTTGAPIHASYWPSRIDHLRGEHPGIQLWFGFPELLTRHLTGRAVVSRSMASGTGLLDRAVGRWSATVADSVGVDMDQLPRILDDDEPCGRLSAVAAARWPRFAHAVWFAAWGDGACSNVGLGATDEGSAALTVGTSGALRAIVAEPAPDIPPGLFAQRLGLGAVVGGQLSEGGGVSAWASRLLGRSAATLERAAAALEPDSHGLTVLPFMFGERSIGYRDHARGAVIGLHPGTDAASLYRAVMESLALSFAAVDERLGRAVGLTPRIVASGGALTRSPVLEQALADALGRDISIASTAEASRRGAALMALRGSGAISDLGATAAPRTRSIRSDPATAARYRTARARRDALSTAILG